MQPDSPIDSTNKHFKGQMANEEVLCFCRKHWIVIAHYLAGLPILWVILLTIGFLDKGKIAEALGEAVYETIAIYIVIFATYLNHRIFIRIFNYYLQTVIITNYRIVDIDKSLFFKDQRSTLDVKEVQDLVLKKAGFFRTILDFGEIDILLSSVSEPHCLRYVPHPEYHFRKINKTKREYIDTRNTMKEVLRHTQEDRYPDIIIQESQVNTMGQIHQNN